MSMSDRRDEGGMKDEESEDKKQKAQRTATPTFSSSVASRCRKWRLSCLVLTASDLDRSPDGGFGG